ncbi:Neurofilament heavy polypeptide [Frankliniella fusca]|uniref:Neurofilament heavy polypeptide n=1 Tax=Frankliniella fusca TaxID=407009 RepID=A0AAE1I2D2_9NEOP|nr:Neurofilament heavy polypeptide [Frankliniella fusca]
MSPQRQTRASVGPTTALGTSKLPTSEMTSPRTRSCSKKNMKSMPSPKLRKSVNQSPSRRQNSTGCDELTPSKKNQSKLNSPRYETPKIAEGSPKKKLQSKEMPSLSAVRSLKTTPKKSLSVQSVPSVSPKSPMQRRSARGTSFGNSPCSGVTRVVTTPSSTKSPVKSTSNALLKSPSRSPLKASPKSPSNSVNKSPSKSPVKSFSKSPHKLSVRSPSRSPSKATARIPSRSQVSPGKAAAEKSPSRPNALSRKRLLASPQKSPYSVKSRRLRGNILSPVQASTELEPDEECNPLVKSKNSCSDDPVVKSSFSHLPKKQLSTANTLPDDPELTGRFLRRKWFSLKTRGGFTCLRSAILSPEEIAQEVLQATMTDTPKVEDANFFTTKLMMRLSSRLPPTRARPSCEELVDLIKSKQNDKKFDALTDQKGEGTAIRVKLERRSFSDTISQINSKPSKVMGNAPGSSKSEIKGKVAKGEESNLSKKQEREIALLQLKNLRSQLAVAKNRAKNSPSKNKERKRLVTSKNLK